jgi:hypothetical protein
VDPGASVVAKDQEAVGNMFAGASSRRVVSTLQTVADLAPIQGGNDDLLASPEAVVRLGMSMRASETY